MESLLNELKESAENIVNQVKGLTPNARFGMGGYTDKPIVPFAYDPDDVNATPAHKKVVAFQHFLSMTESVQALKNTLNRIELVRNVDDPESGFDALAQAMRCEKLGNLITPFQILQISHFDHSEYLIICIFSWLERQWHQKSDHHDGRRRVQVCLGRIDCWHNPSIRHGMSHF